MGKKLLTILFVLLFVLLFVTPALAYMIGDIDIANLNPNTVIKNLEIESGEGMVMKSAAFGYSMEIRVVIAVVSLNFLTRRWEYESIRYLKGGQLHYYTWSAGFGNLPAGYTLTEIPIGLEGLWVMELKQLVDGV